MAMHVQCPGCGRKLKVPESAAGRRIKCTNCGQRMQAPAAADVAAPSPVDVPSILAPEVQAPRKPDVDVPVFADEEPPAKPDSESLFKALREEAARVENLPATPKPEESDEVPIEESPDSAVHGDLSAKKEIHLRSLGEKAGYAVSQGPLPPVTPPPPPPEEAGGPPNPALKWVGAALGLLLLVGIIFGTVYGLKGSKPVSPRRPAGNEPGGAIPGAIAPAAPRVPLGAPPLPQILQDAVQVFRAATPVQIEVADAAAPSAVPALALTPAGDVLLDSTNVQIREKAGAMMSLDQMSADARKAIAESVAAKLTERGITVADKFWPGTRSHLKISIVIAPAWTGFNFLNRSAPPPDDKTPSSPATPSSPPAFSPPPSRRPLYAHPSEAAPETISPVRAFGPATVKLWETLLNKWDTQPNRAVELTARCDSMFRGDGSAQRWSASPSNDPRADAVPCGLRVAIVQVQWEIGGRTFDLGGWQAAAPRDGGGADAGPQTVSRRPKNLQWIQLIGEVNAERICMLSGFCQYADVDPLSGGAQAGEWVAGLLASPEADWRTIWAPQVSDRDTLTNACRNVLRLGGGSAIAEALAANPERCPRAALATIARLLQEECPSPDLARPFVSVKGPIADAALVALARRPAEEDQKDFLQWVAAPAEHSAESVQAACCAEIELNHPGAEVSALIDARKVTAFPLVRTPRACVALPAPTARTVLEWLIRSGDRLQKTGAVAAAAEANLETLRDAVNECIERAGAAGPETFVLLSRALESAQSPMAFDVLAAVAQKKLAATELGDQFAPPSGSTEPPALMPGGRFPRTVAAVVCANLFRLDKSKAGPVFVALLKSPGPATRITAIEQLVALEDWDAAKDVRERFSALSARAAARSPLETTEYEFLKVATDKDHLCKYEISLRLANTLLTSEQPKAAIATCDEIIAKHPSPKIVADARAIKAEAQKKLADSAAAP